MSTPIGPYSPIVRLGDLLVTSGQLGIVPGDDGTPTLVPGGTAAQLEQALANGLALIEAEIKAFELAMQARFEVVAQQVETLTGGTVEREMEAMLARICPLPAPVNPALTGPELSVSIESMAYSGTRVLIKYCTP